MLLKIRKKKNHETYEEQQWSWRNSFRNTALHHETTRNSHLFHFCMTPQLNVQPTNPDWFVLQRKCANPCLDKVHRYRDGYATFIIIWKWAGTPTGIWKMWNVSGHWPEEVYIGNRHLFGQLSKSHPSLAPSSDDGKKRKLLSPQKCIPPQGFQRSVQSGRVNILLYGPIHLLCVCSSFNCKFSVIQIPQDMNVHRFSSRLNANLML